jgi:pyruvate/2-oxoglutarate dehydrogenase complex dihydrolipoamide acyltransferase (E2) component
MGLEDIQEIRIHLKNLASLLDEREVNLKDAINLISHIKAKYNLLVKKNGENYFTKNYPEISTEIKELGKKIIDYSN